MRLVAIKNINRGGYSWSKRKDPSEKVAVVDGVEVGFEQGVSLDLIADWMRNSNFNVNTYAGDIRVAEDEKSSDAFGQSVAIMNAPEVKKVNAKTQSFSQSSEKTNIRNLADYTWSVAQSPDDTQADSSKYDLNLRIYRFV